MRVDGRRPARILIVCREDLPSAVLGVQAAFDGIAAATGECEVARAGSGSVTPDDLAWCDSLVLVRGASPAELRLLRVARRAGRFVATYMDDDLEAIFPESLGAAYFRSLRRPLATILSQADRVLVTSDRLLAELAARHGIQPMLLRQPRPPEIPGEGGMLHEERRRQRERGRVRIAYFGSVENAWFLPVLLEAPLRRLRGEFGDRIDFVFRGAVPAFATDIGASTGGWEREFGAWRRSAVASCPEIALAPLPDTPFHRMKYWNKYLEYGSLGAAGIYSRVPPYTDVVIDGTTGLLCGNDPGEWYAGLRRLIASPEERERIGRAAAADVTARFSPEALLPAWREAVLPMLRHRAPRVSPAEVRFPHRITRELSDAASAFGPVGGIRYLGGRLVRKVVRSLRSGPRR